MENESLDNFENTEEVTFEMLEEISKIIEQDTRRYSRFLGGDINEVNG